VPAALALVEHTTLSILSGQAMVKPAGSDVWAAGVSGQTLAAGDAVKTLADSFALVTYFEGSTTELDPNTELTIQKLDNDAAGTKTEIEARLTVGATWSKVARLIDPSSRFQIETPSAVAVVRGTEFAVRVDADGTTRVSTTTGEVTTQAAGGTVAVTNGQMTTVRPGAPPEPPVTTPAPRYALRLTLASPAAPQICDEHNRCTGVLPVPGVATRARGVNVNHIPEAYYNGVDSEPQEVVFPLAVSEDNQTKRFTVLLTALDNGGLYHLEVAGLVGSEVTTAQAFAGLIRKDARERTGFTIDVGPDGLLINPIAQPRETEELAGARVVARRALESPALLNESKGGVSPIAWAPVPDVSALRRLSPADAQKTPRPPAPDIPPVPTIPPAPAGAEKLAAVPGVVSELRAQAEAAARALASRPQPPLPVLLLEVATPTPTPSDPEPTPTSTTPPAPSSTPTTESPAATPTATSTPDNGGTQAP